MGRRTIEVNRKLLQACLTEAESKGPLENLNKLWVAACEIYNKRTDGESITHSVVMLRSTEWKLDYVTRAGKKGRAAGVPLSAEQKEAMQRGRKGGRAEKFASDPDIVSGFSKLKSETPDRFQNLVTKVIEKGSMRAAVALQCLNCSNFQPTEVKLCQCPGCPLFAFRPYKPKDANDVSEVNEEEGLDVEEVA